MLEFMNAHIHVFEMCFHDVQTHVYSEHHKQQQRNRQSNEEDKVHL